MYTTAIATATPGATKATPNPTYYTHTHPIERSGASSPKGHGQESSHVLLLCLRGIVAFFWAASRRTLERMFLAYLQSTINPTLRFLIANLTAITRRGSGGGGVRTCASAAAEAQALNDKEGAVTYQAGGACVNSKKVSWTYMRGGFSRLYPLFNDRLIERGGEMRLSAGVSLALSELCQDCRYGGGRIPLSAILDLSTCQNFTTIC
jgi:hypothetical protein